MTIPNSNCNYSFATIYIKIRYNTSFLKLSSYEWPTKADYQPPPQLPLESQLSESGQSQ